MGGMETYLPHGKSRFTIDPPNPELQRRWNGPEDA